MQIDRKNALKVWETAFGKVVAGMETVDAIAQTPTDYSDRPYEEQKIKSVTVL